MTPRRISVWQRVERMAEGEAFELGGKSVAHTNFKLPDREYARQRLERLLLQTERDFWQREAETLSCELENIPEAIRKFGSLDVPCDGDTVRLVIESDPEFDGGAPQI